MTNNKGKSIVKEKNKLKHNRSLFLTVTTLTTLLIGGVGATIASIANSDPQNNSISQIKNDTSIITENNDTNFDNLTIRSNPINGFDDLDVYDKDNNITENKLVLITDNQTTINYGIALVDKNMKFISKWLMPTDSIYSLNYTTNIIPGQGPNTFFVLAGINNIAKALNMVYTGYDQTETEDYSKVVTADLTNAPSIKIFKINLENNILISDIGNSVYDFKYPTFDDQSSYNGGLKFFTKSGLFASNHAQQTGGSNNITSNSFGYLQYLYYGQLFQYNYDIKSGDEDEFALISSYLSVDQNLGNMYSFYSSTNHSAVPTLSYYEYFYKDILYPMITGAISSYTNTPYIPVAGRTATHYTIIDTNGKTSIAIDQDQLTINTAMALAFMMDYEPDKVPMSSDNTSTLSGTFKNVGHGAYNIVPGWFIYKPNISNSWVSYGYAYNDPINTIGNEIWATTIGTYYNSKKDTYYTIQALLSSATFTRFTNYSILTYNYFNQPYTEYNSSGIQVYYGNNTVELIYKAGQVWNKSFFIKVLDWENEIIIFSTNTNQIGMFIHNQGQMVLTETQYNFTGIVLKFAYDKELQILSIVTNKNLYSIDVNWNILTPYDTWIQNPNARELLITHPYINYVNTTKILDSKYIFNPDGKGSLNGINILINAPNIVNNEIYSIQSLTSANIGKVIAVLSPKEIGYQPTKNDIEFSANEKSIKIADIAYNFTSNQIKDLFINSDRVPGTTSTKQKNLMVTNTDINNIVINEVIEYLGDETIFGFSIKKEDLINWTTLINGSTWTSYYNNVFVTLEPTIVWYIEPNQINRNSILKQTSVIDMIDLYDDNFQEFQNKYFSVIITNLDNRIDNINYWLEIVNWNEITNSITFQTIGSLNQDQIVISVGNSSANNGLTFTYNNAFVIEPVPNDSLMYIIISICVIIALLIILGLAIGIPLRRNHKMVEKQFKISNKKIDTLTLAIGSVFKAITENIDISNKANLLNNDLTKKQKPKAVKVNKKFVSAPTNPKVQKPFIKSNQEIPLNRNYDLTIKKMPTKIRRPNEANRSNHFKGNTHNK